MAVFNEIITMFGFVLTDQAKAQISVAEKSLHAVSNAAFNMVSSVASAATNFGTHIKSVSENAAAMERMSKATGQSTTQLQEWSYVATKLGGNASVVQADLAILQQKFEGMSIDEIANKLSTQFAGMSEQQKRMHAQSLWISMDTVRVFEQGADGIAKLRAEAHAMGTIIPESAITAAAAFDRGLNILQMTFRSIADQVAMGVTPKLLKLVEATQKWLSENKSIVQEGLAGVLAGIGDAFDIVSNAVQDVWNWFKTLLPSTDELGNSLFTFENVAKFVRGGLVLLAILLAPLIIKFLLIAAAVTAVVLVFSDLMEAFRGGDSVIGSFIENVVSGFEERFPNIAKVIGAISNAVGEFIETFDGEWLSAGFDGLLGAFRAVGDGVMTVLAIVDDFIARIKKAESIWGVLWAVFVAIVENALNMIKSLTKGLFDPFNEETKALWADIETIWNLGAARLQPIIDGLTGPFDKAGAKVKAVFGEAIDWIKTQLAGIGTAITNTIPNIITATLGMIGTVIKNELPDFSLSGMLGGIIDFLGGKDVQDGVESAQQVRLQMGQIPVSANNNMANDNRQMTQNNTYNVTASPESVSALSADMERLAPAALPCAM